MNLLEGYTWDNNVSFECDRDVFFRMPKKIPDSLKDHKDEIEKLMFSAWLEAKRHETLKQ